MDKELFQVQLAIPERQFVKVYKDFLNNEILSANEKLVFIALKSFVTYGRDDEDVFPSMESLCKITSLSRSSVSRAMNDLIKKGIIKKTRRGLTKTNLYVVNDYPSLWGASNVEEIKELSEQRIPLTDEELIEELKRRGKVEFIEKKRTETSLPTKDKMNQFNSNNYTYTENDTISSDKRQEEKYKLSDIHDYYGYNVLIARNSDRTDIIDAVFNIIYKTLNSSKDYVKVNGEVKSSMIVVSKLMKLIHEDILFVVEKYCSITNEIKNPESYILTLLYNAKEQHALEIENQVNRDMANWNNKTE